MDRLSQSDIASTPVRRPPVDEADPSTDESLIEVLIRSMRLRWQGGERPMVEDMLAQCPSLSPEADDVIDLLYEEYCLRKQFGLEATLDVVARRFPKRRQALSNLITFHRLIDEGLKEPQFPQVGDQLGDYRLVAHLGKGGKGQVFLATQTSLSDRPVVLKLTPATGREHLSLARLQHTNIVPLHASLVDTERRLRLLCMPYFGGVTLQHVLEHVFGKDVTQLTGRDLLAALDAKPAPIKLPSSGREPARQLFASVSYVKAVCYLGACLADALRYAHERGLLHLDVKPSNVLLSSDGEPMLLDFHLAHEPLAAGSIPTDNIGGTAHYMPPEQRQAMQAVAAGAPIPSPVDGRADVYALGALLYVMLGGTLPFDPKSSPSLYRINPRVGRALSDLIGRALSTDPAQRPSTADLAEDLRRHLHDQPLLSVRNRSWGERWRKWRQRHPSALRSWLLAIAVVCATGAAGYAAWLYVDHHLDEGELALREGRQKAAARQHEEAIATFQRGIEHLQRLPFPVERSADLSQELQRAEEALAQSRRAAQRADLHRLAERLRGLYGVELSPSARVPLEKRCRSLWENRQAIASGLEIQRDPTAITDFLDIALLWADWQAQTPHTGRQQALQVLDEAEELFGRNLILDFERQRLRSGGKPPTLTGQPRTAWEHQALGRAYFRGGQFALAEQHLQQAVALRLNDRWSHFLLGLCAYRLQRYADAVTAFTFCLGAAPDDAVCSFNRGLAYHALKQHARAQADYDRAIELLASFAPAWQNRGLLHYQQKNHPAARVDLQRALELGAPPVSIHFNLALVAIAENDNATARTHLQQVLQRDPQHAEARALLEKND